MVQPVRRILFISHYFQRNGTESFMMNVYRGIDQERFAVDFLLFDREETDYTKEVIESGGKIWYVTSRRENCFRWLKDVFAFFRQHHNEYSAIHWCGNSLTAIAPLVAAWMYRVPIRIVHGHNSSADGWHNRMLHTLHRAVTSAVTTHHLACSSAAAQWFFGRRKTEIIANGIDTEQFDFAPQIRTEMREQLGLSSDTVVWGHVGRFVNEKNHAFLVELFARYHSIHPKSALLLIGKGILMETIKEQIQSIGLQDSIIMLGEQQQVSRYMQAMDLFVMPSLFEGLPFVLVEAQCSGLPCLISDNINSDSILTPNVGVVSLTTPLSRWCEEAERLTHMVRVSERKTLIQKGYSIRNTIQYLEQIYQ